MELEQYILSHIDDEPDYLHEIWRESNVMLLNGRMVSGHVQGRVLSLLSNLVRPKIAVEIGTFTGYSALCIAEGLACDGILHTFEIDDELEEIITNNFKKSDLRSKIQLHIADATEGIPEMGLSPHSVDFAFIDGDKRDYQRYYELLMPLMRIGGIIIADNTLWSGKIAEEQCHDRQTEGLRLFNDYVVSDERVSVTILPIRDGMTVLRVISKEERTKNKEQRTKNQEQRAKII